jgi:disulfide oxidoreductase YuzD
MADLRSLISQIPMEPGYVPAPPEPDLSVIQRLMGLPQTLRAVGQNLAVGAASLPVGIYQGFGDPSAGEAAMSQFQQDYGYTPTNPAAQRQLQGLGEFLQQLETEYKIPPMISPSQLPSRAATAGSAMQLGRIGTRMTGQAQNLARDLVREIQTTPPTGAVTIGSKSAELSALKARLDELNNQFATDTAPPSAVREHGAVMKRYQELQNELFPRAQTTPAEVVDETAQGLLDTSYRGGHSAPSREFGAQLHQLDQIFPDDIYSPQAARNYGHYGGNDPMDRQTMRLAQSLRGKPDADVTIYRSVPKDEKIKDINQGDWVTINKQYAKEHGESVLLGDYKILEKKVKAKDIWTNADSIHEYGYDPAQSVVDNPFQTAFTQVSPGDEVAGLTVREYVPNIDSISASLDNYEVLSGIRKVPARAFDAEYLDSLRDRGLDKRTADLSEQIKQSKEINPLIVAVDSKGAYIVEGGHRFDALMTQGRDSVPAKVVIDQDDPPTEDFLRGLFE